MEGGRWKVKKSGHENGMFVRSPLLREGVFSLGLLDEVLVVIGVNHSDQIPPPSTLAAPLLNTIHYHHRVNLSL